MYRDELNSSVVLNSRCLLNEFSGVQRYCIALKGKLFRRVVQPATPCRSGFAGHFWEQVVLPIRLSQGEWLYSPANVGPLLWRKQIVTIHDMATFDHPEWFRGAFARWYRFLLPRLARRAAHIITVSNASKAAIRLHTDIAAEKITVIYNGVELGERKYDRVSSRDVAEILRTGRRFILYAGSVEPRKNIRRLLDAWRSIEDGSSDLVLCGGELARVFGQQKSVFEGRGICRMGRVSDSDLGLVMKNAWGFIYPSLYEGFGLPPLEAMSLGCPVVVSNIPAIREVCGPAVDCGGVVEYCDPYSVESIGAALKRLLEIDCGERERRALVGRKWCERFSWDKCAAETAALIDRVIAQEDDSRKCPK